MTRVQRLLAAVIGVELAVGGWLVVRRLNEPAPPLPDLIAVDALAARDIRALATDCHGAAPEWAKLGEALLATGFFPEAERCFGHALRLDKQDADMAFKHGFALERLGRLKEANESYEAAIALNHPRRNECWYYIGKNHLREEQEEAAAVAFLRAGGIPGARYELALLAVRAGRLDEADAEAKRLAGEHPAAYPPVSLRYRLALARGDADRAAALADLFGHKPAPLPTPYDKEVDWVMGAANRVGRNRLFGEAGRQMRAGQLPETEANLRQALAAGWTPEIADKLAETVFQRGRPREAVEMLADAVARDRPSFELLWRLGQAYEAVGQQGAALAAWQRAAQVATGPRALGLWEDLAARFQRSGDNDKAKSARARARLAAGWEALDAGRFAAAIQAFEQAANDEPLAPAWHGLGEAARLLGRVDQARSAYEHCLTLDPGHGGASRGFKLLKILK
jgi:tetratricopeptide (TPR) repeat protein